MNPTYRSQAESEVHLVSADQNLQNSLQASLNETSEKIYLQRLHPEGPTFPTLERNREKIEMLLMGADIAGDKELVKRIIQEACTLGIPFIALLVSEEGSSLRHNLVPTFTPEQVLDRLSVLK